MAAVDAAPDAVLVCGLGRLGQHCVAALKAFGVRVHAVELEGRDHWHVPGVPDALESLSVGDCRSPDVLRRAGIEACRAVVIVTGIERVNVAAAMAAQSLHPGIRIVVRSGQRNLNRLLAQHLGDFVALEPTLLSAPALALAALGDETVGLFRLEGALVRVHRRPAIAENGAERTLLGLNTARKRVLSCRAHGVGPIRDFHRWGPGEVAHSDDVVTFIELDDHRAFPERRARAAPSGGPSPARAPRDLRRAAAAAWASAPQIARVAVASAGIVAGLYAACALFYRLEYPDLGVRDALNVAMVLILGGYDNLFGQLRVPFPIPLWLHALSVLVSVAGTVSIGIVYAFLTERFLSVRFQFFRRHRVPKADHVVIVGLGPLGLKVAEFLQGERRPLVALADARPEGAVPATVPVVVGALDEALQRANVASARSIVAVGDDDVANLEAALTARAMNPAAALVVRADDAGFRDNVARLVSGARVLGVHALAAEAFAAAAFGENIHQLLRVDDRVFLVAEYRVEPGDTLNERLVGEVAHGYGVVPLLLIRADGRARDFLPSDDARLRGGDRFVVLASIDALRSAEAGEPAAPSYRVRVDAAPSGEAAFDAALTIAKVVGCDVAAAQGLTRSLPAVVPTALYANQADRLVRELAKVRVESRVLADDVA